MALATVWIVLRGTLLVRQMLTYGSTFAGIEGFGLGFGRSGMTCRWQVEIDDACNRVLSRHYPDVLRLRDIRECGRATLPSVDVLCGGFPCQDLSVAGKRAGLKGKRSGLFYQLTRVTHELQPRLLVWENVPGLLTNDGGRDFAYVLLEMERIGYSGAWTCLDAQWFGLAQRRRRIFGVFARRDIGADCCAEILSLAARSAGYLKAGKKTRSGVAATIRSRSASPGVSSPGRGGEDDENLVVNSLDAHMGMGGADDNSAQANHLVASPVTANYHKGAGVNDGKKGSPQNLILARSLNAHTSPRFDGDSETFVTHALSSEGADASEDGTGRGTPIVAFQCHGTNVGPMGTIRSGNGNETGGVPFVIEQNTQCSTPRLPSQRSHGTPNYAVVGSMGVRRLTPVECERLQGFPDGWTEGESDSARYRMIGNAVAVPVAAWIGRQIAKSLLRE